MPDLLVNLLHLPPLEATLSRPQLAGISIRRAEPFEISKVRAFIEQHFTVSWADECSAGFYNRPVSLYIAVSEKQVVGFAAYECTRKAYFGPTGVAADFRGRGIGTALLICCLTGLRDLGYVYGIIGGAGPVEFYQNTVGAIVIPDTDPGIYTSLL